MYLMYSFSHCRCLPIRFGFQTAAWPTSWLCLPRPRSFQMASRKTRFPHLLSRELLEASSVGNRRTNLASGAPTVRLRKYFFGDPLDSNDIWDSLFSFMCPPPACEVSFDNVPVPLENVLGEIGDGFKVILYLSCWGLRWAFCPNALFRFFFCFFLNRSPWISSTLEDSAWEVLQPEWSKNWLVLQLIYWLYSGALSSYLKILAS